MCTLKGGEERPVARNSCLRLGLTLLRVFIEYSYLFSIFRSRGSPPPQLVRDHMKLVIVWVGKIGFPDSQGKWFLTGFACLGALTLFTQGTQEFQRISFVLIMLARWLQRSSPI